MSGDTSHHYSDTFLLVTREVGALFSLHRYHETPSRGKGVHLHVLERGFPGSSPPRKGVSSTEACPLCLPLAMYVGISDVVHWTRTLPATLLAEIQKKSGEKIPECVSEFGASLVPPSR